MSGNKKLLGYILIILATALWGIAFVPQKTAMQYTGPFSYNAARFLLAALLVSVVCYLSGERISFRRAGGRGLLLGIVLFAGISLQQIAVLHTTASNAGFITSLYLVLVPLQMWLFFSERQRMSFWFAVLLAILGLGLLSFSGEISFQMGDLWALAGAVMFAQHIIIVDSLVKTIAPLPLAAVQYFIASLLSGLVAVVFEQDLLIGLTAAWAEVLYAGGLSVAVGYTIQLYGQKYISAVHAAMLFSLEGVFAALAASYLIKETLTETQMYGCALVVIALLLASRRNKPSPELAPNAT